MTIADAVWRKMYLLMTSMRADLPPWMAAPRLVQFHYLVLARK